jgi:hypothetical protein
MYQHDRSYATGDGRGYASDGRGYSDTVRGYSDAGRGYNDGGRGYAGQNGYRYTALHHVSQSMPLSASFPSGPESGAGFGAWVGNYPPSYLRDMVSYNYPLLLRYGSGTTRPLTSATW